MLLWQEVNDRDTVIIGDKSMYQRDGKTIEHYTAWASSHIEGIGDLLGGDVVKAVKLLKHQPAGTSVDVQLAVLLVDDDDVSGCRTSLRTLKAEHAAALNGKPVSADAIMAVIQWFENMGVEA